jgi:hypothetical protein
MSVWISQQARFYNAGLNPLLDWKFSLPMMGVLLSTFFPAIGASRVFGIPQVLAQQFWIKVPFIAADVWIALLLRRAVARATGSEHDGRRAGLMWLLNPVAIFYTSVHGQFDALPAALMLLGFLLIQEGRRAKAFGAFLLSGTAKYFAFLLVPLLWAWGGADGGRVGTRTVRVGIATVTVAAFGFASVAVPGLRESLIGGLASNVVGTQASLWSVWIPLASVDRLGLGWVALFLGLYTLVLIKLRIQRSAGTPDPLQFLGATTAILAILIAVDPFANPQFYIWVMPLLIVLAFARRSFLLLSLTASLGLMNLLVFWRSESAAIWFLNAVPDVTMFRGFWSPPPGFVDLGAARGMGFVYGLGLISVGLLGLIASVQGGLHRERTRRWRLAVTGATLVGALCSLGFVVYAFQPSLSSSYAAAPAYPADLARLNHLPAARVWWAPGGMALKASWSDINQKLLATHVNRANIVVVGSSPVEPAINTTFAGKPTPISAAGLNVTFRLPRRANQVAIKVLLGNASYGYGGGPDLPTFSLTTGPRYSHDVPLVVDTESSPALGWVFVMLNQTNTVGGRRFMLEISDARGLGWLWNGGSSEDSQSPDRRSRQWMQVWSFTGPDSSGLRVLSDGRLELSNPLQNSGELDHATVALPHPLTGAEMPNIYIAIDVVSEAWWRSSPWAATGVFIMAVLGPILFGALTLLIAKWGWTGTLRA